MPGYLRFVYFVLAIVLGWMCGHRRGFDKGTSCAKRLAAMRYVHTGTPVVYNLQPTADGAGLYGQIRRPRR